jgi:hypothetical protein
MNDTEKIFQFVLTTYTIAALFTLVITYLLPDFFSNYNIELVSDEFGMILKRFVIKIWTLEKKLEFK